ncbi:MAG: trigger factor [Chloroflexi bacterium]|nr:trigger factor [Chloroflexota bacterium]MBT3669942.1 trigger factor [Chloroflexota bacterium]MBT4001857.1 trigger factor [Chloroflexota bacterium]MBT4304844.1 trigger factor [Chloroflexota bacterium]MBT4534655.1 trigger factor [Chloroflexota bacterium]
MKIEKQFLDDHQVELKVELETETFESAKKRAAKRIAKKVKIAGFRPGKAPYSVVQRQVGDAAIVEDAVDIVLEEVYPKIIEEAEIEPYAAGSLKDIPTMEPPTFEFLVPLSPEVTLGEYKEISIELENKEVSDEDVDKVIDNLREQQAVIEPADRPVEEGDMVYVLLSGEREEPKEDEEKVIVEERRFPVVVEKEETDNSTEWPFPGFSRKLIGQSAEDEKTVKHKFPKDYEYEELQGVKAVYSYKIEEVKARTLPEFNDDFAKTVGEYETAEEMKEDALKNLEIRFEQDSKNEHESAIIDKLVEGSEIKYPPQMLDHEINHFIQDLEGRLSQQGLTMELYLQSRDMDMDGMREEVKPAAEERMKRGIVLMEVASKEEITVTPEEIEEKTQATIQQLTAVYPEEEVKKITSGEALQGLVSRIVSDEITGRTLERLSRIAQGLPIEDEKEEEVSKENVESEDEASKTEEEEVVAAVEENTDESIESAEAESEEIAETPAEDAKDEPEEEDASEEIVEDSKE